jgi:hypothetical protein
MTVWLRGSGTRWLVVPQWRPVHGHTGSHATCCDVYCAESPRLRKDRFGVFMTGRQPNVFGHGVMSTLSDGWDV